MRDRGLPMVPPVPLPWPRPRREKSPRDAASFSRGPRVSKLDFYIYRRSMTGSLPKDISDGRESFKRLLKRVKTAKRWNDTFGAGACWLGGGLQNRRSAFDSYRHLDTLRVGSPRDSNIRGRHLVPGGLTFPRKPRPRSIGPRMRPIPLRAGQDRAGHLHRARASSGPPSRSSAAWINLPIKVSGWIVADGADRSETDNDSAA